MKVVILKKSLIKESKKTISTLKALRLTKINDLIFINPQDLVLMGMLGKVTTKVVYGDCDLEFLKERNLDLKCKYKVSNLSAFQKKGILNGSDLESLRIK